MTAPARQDSSPLADTRPYSAVHKIRGYHIRLIRHLLPKFTIRYRLASGRDFVLHPGNRLSELIYTGRAYEPLESSFCRRFLQNGDVAYDVGANVGYFTALFSLAVGSSGLVLAFEPGISTYGKLLTTIARLDLQNVVPLPLALWERTTIISLFSSPSGDDAQQSVAHRTKHGDDVKPMPVAAVSLSELFDATWFKSTRMPDLIKIDVEGAESQVFTGLTAKLREWTPDIPVLLVEFNAEALKTMGNDPRELLSALEEWYDLFSTPLCWPPWHATSSSFTALAGSATKSDSAESNVVAVPKLGRLRPRAMCALLAAA